jgi:hypothetical protein
MGCEARGTLRTTPGDVLMGRVRRLSLSLAAAAIAVALIPASASAASYCSPSGDLCYGAAGSPVKLRISLAAEYFTRYRLCVRGPDGGRDCKRFRVRRADNGLYVSRVSWPKHFPWRGRGTYRARWYAQGNALGPAIKF